MWVDASSLRLWCFCFPLTEIAEITRGTSCFHSTCSDTYANGGDGRLLVRKEQKKKGKGKKEQDYCDSMCVIDGVSVVITKAICFLNLQYVFL